ncbi:MAG: anaerobic sulfatase maturase, partial [Proteobacteria bacterium]|nr:anaerobic sulfatase maturase [Pseudomonadota bacterium]
IRQYIAIQSSREISFAWQGGEPMLTGLDFFELAVSLQQKYCPTGKTITNIIQTNGTLVDQKWCEFFKKNSFLIGISLDGPEEMHDRYRVDKTGQPSFAKVSQAIELFRIHGVEFNTITVVNHHNSQDPLQIYDFLKAIGSDYLQFIPLVEIRKNKSANSDDYIVSERSVSPADYGNFLCTIFDQWVSNDVGKVFVQLFDAALGLWYTGHSSLCTFANSCGNNLVLEHNGDLYSCDHYVSPDLVLGNIMFAKITSLLAGKKQAKLSRRKQHSLNDLCRQCDVFHLCHGGCPKNHLPIGQDENIGRNYLCTGYKQFFRHIAPQMEEMCQLLAEKQPPSKIMRLTEQVRNTE